MCVSRKGGAYKGNSFLLIVDYRWQEHMPVGGTAKATADSPMTLCVCLSQYTVPLMEKRSICISLILSLSAGIHTKGNMHHK